MIYAFDVAVPAGTTKAAPVEIEAPVSVGVITLVEVRFPPGCAGLVYLSIYRGGHQVWPTNPDGAFRDDDRAIISEEAYEVQEPPTEFTIKAWSPSASYPHTPIVRLHQARAELLAEQRESRGILQRVNRLLFGGE